MFSPTSSLEISVIIDSYIMGYDDGNKTACVQFPVWIPHFMMGIVQEFLTAPPIQSHFLEAWQIFRAHKVIEILTLNKFEIISNNLSLTRREPSAHLRSLEVVGSLSGCFPERMKECSNGSRCWPHPAWVDYETKRQSIYKRVAVKIRSVGAICVPEPAKEETRTGSIGSTLHAARYEMRQKRIVRTNKRFNRHDLKWMNPEFDCIITHVSNIRHHQDS